MSRRHVLTLTAIAVITAVATGAALADDRILLRAEGAPANVLLILDSGASMSFDPETSAVSFLAGGDDTGQFVDVQAQKYTSQYLTNLYGDTSWSSKLARGPKLVQAKSALRSFFNAGFDFNWGFSYYEKSDITIYYLNYVYRVKNEVDTDGDGVADSAQPAMIDGTAPGMAMRFGRSQQMRGNQNPGPVYPVRYGEDGTLDYISPFYAAAAASAPLYGPTGGSGSGPSIYAPTPSSPTPTPSGPTPTPSQTPTPTPTATAVPPTNTPEPTATATPLPVADLRVRSFLVNGPDVATAVSLASLSTVTRVSQRQFYYPAYRWDGVSSGRWVRWGLEGSKTWEEVATHNGISTTDPSWKRTVHDYVLEDITKDGDPWGQPLGTLTTSNNIGARTMYVKEVVEKKVGTSWVAASGSDCPVSGGCPTPRITQVEYAQHFVLYDRHFSGTVNDDPQPADTFSAMDYTGSADCQGYLDTGNSVPIVPMDQPDPGTGATVDQRWLIEPYLGPQTQPIFYFPEHSPRFLPQGRVHFIPLTETIAAMGRRPIKDTINEAKYYFDHTVDNWDDPLANCRMNFVIIITDGVETCSNTNAPCSAAANIAPVPVYVIYFGGERNAMNPDLSVVECVADESGGLYFEAGDEQELVSALLKIAYDIEERTRGFSSPIVPSVETTTDQTAYISTFTPKQSRSIWRGHLRAYPVDPNTGIITGLRVDGTPNPLEAKWDAGDTLALRSAASRKVYFGVDAGEDMPGVREEFVFPASDSSEDLYARALLYGRIFPDRPWVDPVTLAEDADIKQDLEDTINFIRGEAMVRDASDPNVIVTFGRDTDHYGWCARTGDVADGDPEPCQSPGAVVVGVEKMGDIFHSTPQLLAAPRCFPCWFQNLWSYRDDVVTDLEDDGFASLHKHRRQVIFAGSDDGTFHAFDAGMWDADGAVIDGEQRPPMYDSGSGRELFAWVPTGVMDTLDDLAFVPAHEWTVDATATVADIYVDADFSSTPDPADREWRSVVIMGQREGGRSYVVLDVTQPDPVDNYYDPEVWGDLAVDAWSAAQGTSRDVLCADGSATGCSGQWPAFRLEFTDEDVFPDDPSDPDDVPTYLPRDEDNNGIPDLGFTWSRPLVGFLKVDHDGNSSTAAESRMVAFFGGGFSADGVYTYEVTGNFVYGLDLETGRILFKEQVVGMVAGDVAGVDVNIDGYLESLYFGTTEGYLYKIDLETDGQLGSVTVPLIGASPATETRVVNWVPQAIFVAPVGQPFFMRPALAPISFNNDGSPILAVAIGTGNRDEIMEANVLAHRFYVIVDKAKPDGTPITEADLTGFTMETSAADGADLLIGADAYGWYLAFEDADLATDDWEKVNTAALILQHMVIFSTFNPSSDVQEVPIYDTDDFDGDGNTTEIIGYACRRGGNARTYVLELSNGNPAGGFDADGDGEPERFEQHDSSTAMATEPVVYLGADGEIHVIQALDNLKLEEPIESFNVTLRAVNWKEE